MSIQNTSQGIDRYTVKEIELFKGLMLGSKYIKKPENKHVKE